MPVRAIAEAMLGVIDLVERFVLRGVDNPAELEAYINERNGVRDRLMSLVEADDPASQDEVSD